jgi:ParB/RepB/Spo0J family partition protein
MASTAHGQQTIALERIRVPDNVRDLDAAHVDALARSIALQGMLVPIVVRPVDDGVELVAGFHRAAAAVQLGMTDIPVVVRDGETEDADRAVENIARKQLNPYEEARAVKAMLDRGLTEKGAADLLGWSVNRVTARVKILELPERAQQMIGAGAIPLSAVEQLRAIGRVAPLLLDCVIAFLEDGNEWAAERLSREPGWVLDSAIRDGEVKTFVSYMDTVSSYEIAELRLGKKVEEQFAEAEKLYKQVTPHAYGPPPIRFEEEDVDRARAAEALIEFDRGRPLIVDRSLYRELAKRAVKRAVEDLRVRAADMATQRPQARKLAPGADADPVDQAKRERDQRLRSLGDEAHGINLDLGTSLLKGLSCVDPQSLDVARFFVYALLGPDYDGSSWTHAGERVQHLAVVGVRLMVEELRADVTKTKKDGTRGRLRIDYGNPQEPDAAIKWLWKYVDGARTAGELYGRALVVIAAEQYAARIALPASQRTYRTRWGSHRDLAAKALKKLAGPHVPASVKQLERAIDRVHAAHQQAIDPKPTARASDEQDRTQSAGHETEGPNEGLTDEAHPADDPPPHAA